MELESIQQFRTTLRKFERDVAVGQKNDDRTGGLSVVQSHTVINLGELGETTIGQMADQMAVDKSTLSRTIENLVKKDLVSRAPDPADRRYLRISLTKKGCEVCKELNRVNNDYIRQVFSRISELDHESVMTYFNMFVNAMREKTG
jgi:DNA-binding MarR family transcriptional regulator